MNLQTFLSEALKNNGGSYNITTGEYNPTDGYMVSLPNNELVVDVRDLLETDVLSAYIINNSKVFIFFDMQWIPYPDFPPL